LLDLLMDGFLDLQLAFVIGAITIWNYLNQNVICASTVLKTNMGTGIIFLSSGISFTPDLLAIPPRLTLSLTEFNKQDEIVEGTVRNTLGVFVLCVSHRNTIL
jgi:hypothetical protein